jgi:hypothetical protein
MVSMSKKGLEIIGITDMLDNDKCVEKLPDYVRSEFSDTDDSSDTYLVNRTMMYFT